MEVYAMLRFFDITNLNQNLNIFFEIFVFDHRHNWVMQKILGIINMKSHRINELFSKTLNIF